MDQVICSLLANESFILEIVFTNILCSNIYQALTSGCKFEHLFKCEEKCIKLYELHTNVTE